MYGVTGSVKTKLAPEISNSTYTPWYSVNDKTNMLGWTVYHFEDQYSAIGKICLIDDWILDTGYAIWLEIPSSRAEMIRGRDYAPSIALWRLLNRTLMRISNGKAVCNGKRETMEKSMSLDSTLLWHFKSFAKNRRRIRQWVATVLGVFWLRGPAASANWLKEVQHSS